MFPDPAPSGYSVPPWVDWSGGPRCVVVDASLLKDPPTSDPGPALSTSQDVSDLTDEIKGLRSLYLYSAGLTICLLGMIAFRSRR